MPPLLYLVLLLPSDWRLLLHMALIFSSDLQCLSFSFFAFLCMLLVQNQISQPLLNSFMPMSPNAKPITLDRLYGRAMHAILVLFRSFLMSYLISVLWYSKPSFVLCQRSPLHTRARKLFHLSWRTDNWSNNSYQPTFSKSIWLYLETILRVITGTLPLLLNILQSTK